jgi:uncharacterized tellurite resistance protein B-like protein
MPKVSKSPRSKLFAVASHPYSYIVPAAAYGSYVTPYGAASVAVSALCFKAYKLMSVKPKYPMTFTLAGALATDVNETPYVVQKDEPLAVSWSYEGGYKDAGGNIKAWVGLYKFPTENFWPSQMYSIWNTSLSLSLEASPCGDFSEDTKLQDVMLTEGTYAFCFFGDGEYTPRSRTQFEVVSENTFSILSKTLSVVSNLSETVQQNEVSLRKSQSDLANSADKVRLEKYMAKLETATADKVLDSKEKKDLKKFRQTHKISDAEHEKCLGSLNPPWTVEEFDIGERDD